MKTMKHTEVKLGMRLVETWTNGFNVPLTVTEVTEEGFKYKFDNDIQLGPRYGYISKDSECEAYHMNGEMAYKLEKDYQIKSVLKALLDAIEEDEDNSISEKTGQALEAADYLLKELP